jgi:hypothetical protein
VEISRRGVEPDGQAKAEHDFNTVVVYGAHGAHHDPGGEKRPPTASIATVVITARGWACSPLARARRR